jgi:protein Tex
MAGSERTLKGLIERYGVRAIAIGNGTASRETDAFVREFLRKGSLDTIFSVTVNESGASIYSASEVARQEFPDLDLTVRGAISIARRLQDPLAELVKLDPKSIGVGQYQHDVDQRQLQKSLESVIESCVNRVGVELNTASWTLLRYVAGISERTAQKIVEYRNEKGVSVREFN